ncbi:heme-binding domain-containing protein [Allomuricauda sp. SCSIO 65647]|uniref:heme-binding domain-containing protein n=1 Tax=Allomuricauda sp. SCSIO 65647 TaxID=2908843 RepID=UPI001F37433F|nr:heme-binding domain-containing protein [Muricauda sp. SCSIO 65647]UJH67662.1 heme-binding domain-containing protein [Muricauda sp. SCSIO 65647]
MKIAKKIAVALLVVFVVMQFIRPDKNVTDDPDYVAVFESETNPSQEVKQLLETTCYDCHSDNTVYPWYNNIAPVSYWLADHIEHGKGHLDFSNWENYDAEKKDHKLEEIIEEVKEEKMPLKEYTWTHQEARLTQEQRETISAWAQEARLRYGITQ